MEELKELLDELTLNKKPFSIDIKLNFDNDCRPDSSEASKAVCETRNGIFVLKLKYLYKLL